MNASGWLKSRLLLLSWAIALGIGGLVVFQLLDSRAAIWQRTEAANTNLLATVSHVLERTLQTADRGIQHSVGIIERSIAASAAAGTVPDASGSEPVASFGNINVELLFAAVATDGYGAQLVLDRDGHILFASQPPPPGKWELSFRSYFTAHKYVDDTELFIGPPFLSSCDGEPTMALSRRWNLPDGSFGGVVVQTIKLSLIHALFNSFELGSDSGINVFLKDGSVVTRFPYSAEHIGSSLQGTPNFERFRREGQGSFRGVGVIDGVDRLYVFRTLDPFPLIINVAQATHSMLAAWQRHALWMGGATLLLMCAGVALAVFAEKNLLAQQKTAQRLRQAQHELRTIVDSLPVMIAYWDRQLINRMSNVAHLHWMGVHPKKMVGRHIDELLDASLRQSILPHIEAALAGHPQTFENILPDTTGSPRHASTTFIPDHDNEGVKGFFVMVTDITERKVAETALVEEKERFRIILESIKDGVITTDREGRVLYLNPAAAAMTGWTPEQAREQPIETVMSVESPDGGRSPCPLGDVLSKREAFKNKVEQVLVSRDQTRVHIENSGAPIFDANGRLRGAVVVFHEVGQVRAIANKMTHLAQHDALTGLPNRRRLDMVGREALTLARAEGRRMAVLYLDLDGFKKVNDEYGHAVGDELLVAMSGRLSARLRSSDSLYRQGGDEFIVLMGALEAPEDAGRLAERLIESCRTPVSVAGQSFSVTVSIGISVFPDDAGELSALIRRADWAMYVAKNSGRNRCVRANAGAAGGKGGKVSAG